jgi:xanthine dehydrogenase/oxidase
MTQCTTKTQALVAGCLGIPRSKVNVKVKRIGGAFGGKEVRSTYTSGVLAIAATILKRPIKWLLTRGEDMQITGGRHPFLHKWKAAVHKSTGRIQGLSVKMFANGGNTASTTEDVMNRGIMHVCNAYKISAVQVEGYLCYTNLPSNTAYRGFGAPQTMMVIETVMDAASKALCLPREELQFQNLMESGMHTHYGQLVPHCRLKEMFEDVMNRR